MSGGEQLQKLDHRTIVQRYITNPYLINGYKWDLRLYAVVTSVSPLNAYIFEEGLVRFSSQPFSLAPGSLSNKFMHLTNSSVNKGAGAAESKWTLSQLRQYLEGRGVNYRKLFSEIKQLLTLTLLTMSAECLFQGPPRLREEAPPYFEFFGFDVMVDSTLRPWLIEANSPP